MPRGKYKREPGKYPVKLSIRIGEDTYHKLVERCQLHGVSVTQGIRHLIEEAVNVEYEYDK